MTENSCNDKIGMRFLIFGVLIGCALLAAGAMADVQNVTVVSVEPGFPGVNAYDITFGVEQGLTGGVGAIFVTFDENTTVPADLANHPECITVKNNTGVSGHPSLVWVLDEDTETGDCDPCPGTTVKMITPVNIPSNTQAEVIFSPCANITSICPVNCEGDVICIHTDREQCPVQSDPFFLQVAVEAFLEVGPHQGGIIVEPDGTVVTTGETDTLVFDACDTPSYTVIPDACHVVCNVIVDDFLVPEDSPNLQRFENHTVVYTYDPLRCNSTFTANFCPCQGNLTINASDGPGGNIDPIGDVPVNCSDDQAFVITPNECSKIFAILIDGNEIELANITIPEGTLQWAGEPGDLGVSATFTFVNVTANHTIHADKKQGVGNLTLEKSGPESVNRCENFTYTLDFQFESDEGIFLNDTVLVDQLPSEVTFVSADQGGVFDEATNTVTWDIGDLGSGAVGTFMVNVTASGPACGSIATNNATINGTLSCGGTELTDADTMGTTILALPVELSINKTGPMSVNVSDTFTYTLDFAFDGDPCAPFLNGTLVTDQLPAEVTFVSADKGGEFDPGSNSVIWTLGDIAPGTNDTFHVTVTADGPCNITITNVASITGVVCASPPITETATWLTAIEPCPCDKGNLTLTKSAPEQVSRCDTFVYTLGFQFDSTTGASLDDSVLVDQLPSEVEFVSADEGGVFDPMTNTVTWSFGTLPAGTDDTVNITVTAAGPLCGSVITNSATMTGTSSCPDHPPLTTSVEITTTILPQPVTLTLDKTGPAFVDKFETFTYTLEFAFDGEPCAPFLNDTVLVDQLPPEVEFVSADKGGVYDGATHTVTWTIGDITPDTSDTFALNVNATGPFTTCLINNTAVISGLVCDSTLSETDTWQTEVDGGEHNVTLTKTASVEEVGPNGRVTYTLVFCYTDSSCLPLNLTNAAIIDYLPDPTLLRFESADKGGVFHPENNTVTWNFGDIPPNTCGIVNITLFVPVREFDPVTFNNATFTGIRNGQTLQANASVSTMVNPFVIPSQAEFMEFQNFNMGFVGSTPVPTPVQNQNVTSGLQFRIFDWNFKIF
jgi:hypothetical protein